MTNEVKYIVILASNNYASFLYKKLKRFGYRVEYISAPVGLAKSCKKAVRFNESDLKIVRQEISKNRLRIKGIYKIVVKNRRTSYVLVR